MAKAIPLTKGFVALVDDVDHAAVSAMRWYARMSSGKVYATRDVVVDGCKRKLQMHRMILGAPEGALVDHEDGNGLNNQRSNLRLATKTTNGQNAKLRANHPTGFKGVRLDRREELAKRWMAAVRVDGKPVWLGRYATVEEAARAYDAAAMEHFGEFALTNVGLGVLPALLELDPSSSL
jgi:hypothetical protein